ncbi:MAG: outer membrane beta-barrel protein [Steroidobacteraceae bacterium]
MNEYVMLLATSAALANHVAAAADNGLYVGASMGAANTNFSSVDLKDTQGAYKIIAGIRPLSLLAVEANYVDFGKARDNGNTAKSRAMDVFAVAFLPIPVLDVYAKLGYANWKVDSGVSSSDFKHSGSDLAYGGGIQFGLGSLSGRVEYEKFNVSSGNNLSLISAGLTWTFL